MEDSVSENMLIYTYAYFNVFVIGISKCATSKEEWSHTYYHVNMHSNYQLLAEK